MRFLRHRDGPQVPEPAAGRPTVRIDDVSNSQIIVGNGSAAIRLTLDGVSVLAPGSSTGAGVATGLRRRAGQGIRRLSTVRERPALVGRDVVVTRAVADLADGRSVQLFGAPGAGRRAVAHAVVEQLGAAGHADTEVHVLEFPGPHTLSSLYTQLARHYFEATWYEPDEETLRAAVELAGVNGIVVIVDCDLPADDIDRMLGTFQECVFLLTSRQQTLFSGDASAYEIDSLTLGQARDLLARELATSPADLPNAQVEEAYRMAEGRTQRLIRYAAFTRLAARHQSSDQSPDPPQSVDGIQALILPLISGLSDPARRVLISLAGFDIAVPPELFQPLIGFDPASDLNDIVSELESSSLVTRWAENYAAAPDVAAALAATGQTPNVQRVADTLTAFVANSAKAAGETPPQLPPQLPNLCLAVTRSLRAANALDRACSLARVAAPAALASGDVDAWARLVAVGVQCATAVDRSQDIAYFLREQHTGALLHGDQAAATAALTALGRYLAT